MITIDNITVAFAGLHLLDQTSLHINPGEKIGMVGRNGSGKSTILKMLNGELTPESGNISIPKQYRIGMVDQHIRFSQKSVLAETALGLPEERQDEIWQAEKILHGLGFTNSDFERPPSEFSGGYQVRINLAKALVASPNLLLLDEPTNYLDIVSIRWLRRFLNAWRFELILVTHDRGFMDDVVTHTAAIHRRKIRKIKGTSADIYEQIEKEEEIHEKTRLNEEKKRKDMERFINRFRAKARLAGLVQSRIKALEKQKKLEKLEDDPVLAFHFREADFPAKHTLTAEDLHFHYPGSPEIIQKVSLTVKKDDRICIIGRNGKGKTTLLRLLCDDLPPTAGDVKPHPKLEIGYFGQTNVDRLSAQRTIEEELSSVKNDDRQVVRDICGLMMFPGDTAQKPIRVLSGGERARVLLGKILLSPANMLFLDEPTHHLDMESCDSLLAALQVFHGAVIMVTHNELFLRGLANRLIIFSDDGVEVFEGGYQDFLERKGWDDVEKTTENSDSAKPSGRRRNKKELRRLRAEITASFSQKRKTQQKKVDQCEQTIEELEETLREIDRSLAEPDRGDTADLSKRRQGITGRLEDVYGQLETASNCLNTLKAEQERELANLR